MRLAPFAGLVAIGLFAACEKKEAAPPPAQTPATPAASAAPATPAAPTIPDSFKVAFETSHGKFVIQVNTALAPKGAERFKALVDSGFFKDERFFRVVPGFVVQFGLSADPKDNAKWDARILDDSVKGSNTRGTFVFATQGPNTRTHQFFINLGDNARLDGMGFAPLGRVIQGMEVVDKINPQYGEDPAQQFIQAQGNDYLDRMFPKLDYIKSAKVVP